eukprot:14920227-Ditylum_brightwellii.AAC.1
MAGATSCGPAGPAGTGSGPAQREAGGCDSARGHPERARETSHEGAERAPSSRAWWSGASPGVPTDRAARRP